MFRRIEAKDYRGLREVSQQLGRFEILVGANASGKSTFLDVLAFLRDFVAGGLDAAVERRTANFHDLVWGRSGVRFRLQVQASPPAELAEEFRCETISYVASFALHTDDERVQVENEVVELQGSDTKIAARVPVSRSNREVAFRSETDSRVLERNDSYPVYSSLNSIPSDSIFPATAWLREQLRNGVTSVALDAKALANPSPPGRAEPTQVTGLGLARSIADLKTREPAQFQRWVCHVRTAFPDLATIDSVLRPEDKHRYLMLGYQNGIQVPSWMVSEGTLRLLALTSLAYLPETAGVYLIEEPETAVHPAALETIFQSLSSVYKAQVLIASHSPILLNMASPKQVLVFSKTDDGTKIVRGSEHPALKDWQNDVTLGTLAASGILG